MAYELTSLSALLTHGFDTVIDVRSPAEHAEDHIPGAISLPALTDEERARVGTVYKQESPFHARKIGAALVARNVADHLDGPLADMGGGWQPLLYCWRGGQRSGSVATILREIGWRVEVLKGGYRSFRREVVASLYDRALAHRVVVLDGYTGTAKTDLLARIRARGEQVVDLEGLANHRGSVLGPRPGGQPGQKAFETALAMALAACDPARPVVVEAESSKVGAAILPPSLWKAMTEAPRIEVEAPVPARAVYLARAYADLAADPEVLVKRLELLIPLQGRERVDAWAALARKGDHATLAVDLIEAHYDPRYAKSRARFADRRVATVSAQVLNDAALDALAEEIAVKLAAIAP